MTVPSASRFGVIIVGSGDDGATLAHQLAPTCKCILVPERGDWLLREAKNWSSREVFGRHRYTTREQWRDAAGDAFKPSTLYKVCGNTKIYGAASFRRRELDFVDTLHADGVAPAWPLSYAHFAPYYLQAKCLYQVHGTRGADPTEPPEAAPYPLPALAHEPLCALREPSSHSLLAARVERGSTCPRKALIESDTQLLQPLAPHALDNINTPQELASLRASSP